jgi:hypothetical protein
MEAVLSKAIARAEVPFRLSNTEVPRRSSEAASLPISTQRGPAPLHGNIIASTTTAMMAAVKLSESSRKALLILPLRRLRRPAAPDAENPPALRCGGVELSRLVPAVRWSDHPVAAAYTRSIAPAAQSKLGVKLERDHDRSETGRERKDPSGRPQPFSGMIASAGGQVRAAATQVSATRSVAGFPRRSVDERLLTTRLTPRSGRPVQRPIMIGPDGRPGNAAAAKIPRRYIRR